MKTNTWQTKLNGDSLAWLLEPDEANPGVRYFALRDLLDRPETDPDVAAAQETVMTTGPVPIILNAQALEGYWAKPGGGYSPKYRGTVWQIIFLAELGADPTDERVQRGCEYLIERRGRPSKWTTLRVLRVLKSIDQSIREKPNIN